MLRYLSSPVDFERHWQASDFVGLETSRRTEPSAQCSVAQRPDFAESLDLGECGYLAKRLSAFVQFDNAELRALDYLGRNASAYGGNHMLIHEGRESDSIYLLLSGFACQFKMLVNGRRQVLGYLVPGDLCDVHFALSNTPVYSVGLMGECSVARIPFGLFEDLVRHFPRIGRALALAAVIEANILREWLLNVGQRNALQKLSHLFCEMASRHQAIGAVAEDGSFALPVNQVALGDALGLTPVHVNRTLQIMRKEGLISLCRRRLVISDRKRLAMIASFDGAYLHASDRSPIGRISTPTEPPASLHSEEIFARG